MPASSAYAALLAAVGLVAASGGTGAAPVDPLAPYRWAKRVLVAAAPQAGDARLEAQHAAFAAMEAGARERDLVLVDAVGPGPAAAALRAALGLDPGRFTAVLVGKDGGAKLRAETVLGPDQLFPLIDAMPMRRAEMARRPAVAKAPASR